MRHYLLLTVGLLASSLSWAGAYEFENAKLHCVFLKNGKVIKQQNCTADGYEHAGAAYGGGQGYTFHLIKGYGKIRVDTGVSYSDTKMDKDGSPMVEEEWTDLNGKPARVSYRIPKTFKLATQKQIDNNPNKLYTCYTPKKNAKYEFCYLPKD